MNEMTPEEVAAMWLWGREYGPQPLSAADWYAQLSESRKRTVADFVGEMRQAFERYELLSSRGLPDSTPGPVEAARAV
jgi:hypothetical protein